MVYNILQVNVKPNIPGERGLPKFSVPHARLTFRGLEGDYNNYRLEKMKKNRLDRAVLILHKDIIDKLNEEDWPVQMGDLGENLTVASFTNPDFALGQRYRIGPTGQELGSPIVRIAEEATPCAVLANLPYIGKERVQEFIATLVGRRGWYAAVEEEGVVGTGYVLRRIS